MEDERGERMMRSARGRRSECEKEAEEKIGRMHQHRESSRLHRLSPRLRSGFAFARLTANTVLSIPDLIVVTLGRLYALSLEIDCKRVFADTLVVLPCFVVLALGLAAF